MKGSGSRIYVAGHEGLVGGALCRELSRRGERQPITRTRRELDLREQVAVREFFRLEKPDVVFLAAAKVGGIHANDSARWEFLLQNLQIQTNVISSALDSKVERLVFFGSSCVYPRLAEQPITEEALLTGPLEPTNEAYAVAKIAGLKLVEAAVTEHGKNWVSLMPTNLYGPGDNFDPETSHVLPAMIRKFHDARVATENGKKENVELWGSGTPKREFLHVDDLAQAACDVAASPVTGILNVGYGSDISIGELSGLVASAVGYEGEVRWDASRSDGTPRKLLDSSRLLENGWRPRIALEDGVRMTYEWFLKHAAEVR